MYRDFVRVPWTGIILALMCVFVLFTPYKGWRDDGFYLSRPQIANLNAAKSTKTRQIK